MTGSLPNSSPEKSHKILPMHHEWENGRNLSTHSHNNNKKQASKQFRCIILLWLCTITILLDWWHRPSSSSKSLRVIQLPRINLQTAVNSILLRDFHKQCIACYLCANCTQYSRDTNEHRAYKLRSMNSSITCYNTHVFD